jgi:FtsX-like permease family
VLAVGEVRTKSVAVPAIGLSEGRHPVLPTLAAGRLPTSASEIALGETTMARLHTHIGGVIHLALAERGPTRAVRVVGRVVLPGLAPYPGADKAGLGVGALLTEAGWARFSSDFGKLVYVIRWRPGANDATLNRYVARVDPHDAPVTLSSVYQPAGIRSLVQLRATPTFLAAMLVALLAAAVANSLVVAVRRRRHDLAVLRTLGFTAGQVLRTVLWQASTVAVIALVVGIPVGLVLGRWTWTLLAQLLGTVPEPMIPAAGIVLLAVAVLALTNLVGVIPGIRASRTPGPSLRAE